MRVKAVVAMIAATLALAACGTDADSDLPEPVASTDTTTTTTDEVTTTLDLEMEEPMPDDSPLIESAIRDLAKRLTVASDDVEVVQAKPVTWPDGAMGCPEDGMSYTQATVVGSEIVLGANGRVYKYHAGPDGSVFLCPSDEKDGGYDFVPPPGIDE